MLTNPQYWDCNCLKNYIHHKVDRYVCPKCGAKEEEQPDSRVDEIRLVLLRPSESNRYLKIPFPY